MYTRALLFNIYSRLAALYSILETGRQPSFGGIGFAIADAQASNVVLTRATDILFLRNDISPVRCDHFRRYRYVANSAISTFASFRSRVSKPSVNQLYTGASSSR